MAEKSLIEFPCNFPLKIIGLLQDNFAQTIANIVKEYDKKFDETCIEMRPSKQNNYLALSLSVYVENQDQLDNIYKALSSHKLVKFVL